MGYKFKPNKGIGKRMKVTGTGKIKHRHEKNSHHRSGRTGALKRRLGRAAVLHEGHSKNMRKFLGLVGIRPDEIRHERELAAAATETKQD
jgi:large subunit ribosomal protein L35